MIDGPSIPIRVNLDRETGSNIREDFLWRLKETAGRNSAAAAKICQDHGLMPAAYESYIAQIIDRSLKAFSSGILDPGAAGHTRVLEVHCNSRLAYNYRNMEAPRSISHPHLKGHRSTSLAERKRHACLLDTHEEAQEIFDAPIQAGDLSFGHWVASPEDEDDTASSNSASSKAAQCGSPLAEDLLMCDEEIGECTQRPPKRQRKSRVGVTSNLFTAGPSKAAEQGQLSWLQNNLMQVSDIWFELSLPHHMMPNSVHPMPVRMHA
ncbi:hypothetical protein WJX75_009160 [Coccomyxa subellipsoidea]|uniref:Uncharacterized protein n=1 Tax=Coccomyxa subellipsoidea TaxID=248742 RepID=A0ABR2YV75_9CHLO